MLALMLPLCDLLFAERRRGLSALGHGGQEVAHVAGEGVPGSSAGSSGLHAVATRLALFDEDRSGRRFRRGGGEGFSRRRRAFRTSFASLKGLVLRPVELSIDTMLFFELR